MSQPTVCAVMLVNGRDTMVKRAIKSFREQTYPNRTMIYFDTGSPNVWDAVFSDGDVSFTVAERYGRLIAYDEREHAVESIGQLRNRANALAKAEILIHFDSDDWSHPNRIEEQVALLQSSGKQCVGYRDMLFWQTCSRCNEGRDNTLPNCPYCGLRYDPSRETPVGEAWLYTNPNRSYCLGTSLCYWRSVWEARPFPDLPKKKGGPAEDVEWLREVDSLGESSIYGFEGPRMIASIHGGNTQYYNPAEYVARQMGTSWKRAAQWDGHCLERMASE